MFDTPIGQNLRGNARGTALCCVVAIVAVGVDFWMSAARYSIATRLIVAAAVIVVYMSQRPFDRASLGFRLLPVQPLRYWVKAVAIASAILMIPIVLFSAWALHKGWDFPRTPPHEAAERFVYMCVMSPILEELLYRLGICYPAAAVVGPRGAILLSGAIFAALHFVYGNPAPDNFFAGYILAWTYLKSGSLALPIVLHSLGNVVALGSQVANWYAF